MQEAPVLRPLSVGEMIDRIIRLIRADLVLFAGIVVIPALVVELIQRASGFSQTIDPGDFTKLLDPRSAAATPRAFAVPDPGAIAAVALASLVVSLIVYSSITAAVGERYLGRPITIRGAYERGLRAIPAIFIAVFLCFVALAVLLTLFGVAIALFNSAALTAVAVIVGLIAFFVVIPWAFLSLAVLGPVTVIERLGPIAAIRRSFHLLDRSRWRTLGLYFLVGIITSILGLVFSVVFFVSFVTEPTARTVLQAIATVASSAITGPLIYGSLVILYYDLRVRKEAFDLQLAAEALPREG